MKNIFRILAVVCVLSLAGNSRAATAAAPQAGKPVQDKPEKGADRVSVVSVQL